ncbi:MAG TPA: TlpA family protein disulfide reductase [Gammaproteobacteria bacterium]|nr:TlpA family protein disulfide reductase [Gammaproteobacteria bacterium]
MLTKSKQLIFGVCFLIGLSSLSWATDKGKPIDLTAYKDKVVLVDFWASWCSPCRQSFPWLNKMQQKYEAKGLVIIGVNVDENSEDAHKFLKKHPALFKLLFDPKGEHASYYKIPGMPTTLIFDRKGVLQHSHSGFKKKKRQEYEQIIKQALAL